MMLYDGHFTMITEEIAIISVFRLYCDYHYSTFILIRLTHSFQFF